jgi:hypothetical protein
VSEYLKEAEEEEEEEEAYQRNGDSELKLTSAASQEYEMSLQVLCCAAAT